MKILKPGKIELRKFTCERCGCEYLAVAGERWGEYTKCPQGCGGLTPWKYGEPYEEPVQSDMDRLITVLYKNWAMDDEFADDVAQKLIANGVTFREG